MFDKFSKQLRYPIWRKPIKRFICWS